MTLQPAFPLIMSAVRRMQCMHILVIDTGCCCSAVCVHAATSSMQQQQQQQQCAPLPMPAHGLTALLLIACLV
jgi:hypothetical protein